MSADRRDCPLPPGDRRRDFDAMDLLPLRGLASRLARALDSVLDLHTKRKATNDYMAPYEYEFCVECRQTWPCATVAAVMNNAQRPSDV